jgi:hypothetical protein
MAGTSVASNATASSPFAIRHDRGWQPHPLVTFSTRGPEFAQADVLARELPPAGPGVLQAPEPRDAAFLDPEEVDLVDPHPPPRRVKPQQAAVCVPSQRNRATTVADSATSSTTVCLLGAAIVLLGLRPA